MNVRRLVALSVIVVVLAGGDALAQSTPAPSTLHGADPPARLSAPVDENAWSFSAYAYAYIVPDDANFLQPTVTADRGRLHLEARYNYEDFNTGSLWVGYNLSARR